MSGKEKSKGKGKRQSSDSSGQASKGLASTPKRSKTLDTLEPLDGLTQEDGAKSSGKRKPNRFEHPPPNQAIKFGFKTISKMPAKVNDWAKKIISVYWKSCLEQEVYTFMVIKNLATMMANYILFKSAIEPLNLRYQDLDSTSGQSQEKNASVKSQQNSSKKETKQKCPGMNYDFYTACLSTFNINSNVATTESFGVQPRIAEFREHVEDYLEHGCPKDFKPFFVIATSTGTQAKVLETNANLYFRTKSKVLVKRLVDSHNKDLELGKACSYLADILLKEEFLLTGQQKDGQKHTFKNDIFWKAFENTKREINYKKQPTELKRWLFFHEQLLKVDRDYRKESLKRTKWSPLCKPSKRPHISLNQTEVVDNFIKKAKFILLCLAKNIDPFCEFNYPTFVSPLRWYFKQAPLTDTQRKDLQNMRKNNYIRAPIKPASKHVTILWGKIKKVYDYILENSKILNVEGGKLAESGTTSSTSTTTNSSTGSKSSKENNKEGTSKQVKKITTVKEYAEKLWSYVLPSLKNRMKRSAYEKFLNFGHLSTNGIDLSIHIYNSNKVKAQKMKPSDLTWSSISKKSFVGVDPGVTSLVTSTYGNFLHTSKVDNQPRKYEKRSKARVSTFATSKEMFHKGNIECGLLARFRRNFTSKIKQKLMSLPYNQEGCNGNSPSSFFSTYPHHKNEPKDIMQFIQLNRQYYIEASRVHFVHTSAGWSWSSYRFQQIKYASLAKRVVAPAMCKDRAEYQRVWQESIIPKGKCYAMPDKERDKVVKSLCIIPSDGLGNQKDQNVQPVYLPSSPSPSNGKESSQIVSASASHRSMQSIKASKLENLQDSKRKSEDEGKKSSLDTGQQNKRHCTSLTSPISMHNGPNSSSIVEIEVRKEESTKPKQRVTLKMHLQRPWLKDLLVFKKCKRNFQNKLYNGPILVAFGDKSRNNAFVKGHYKSSSENVFESLVHLIGRENVVDANEHNTSQECHLCSGKLVKDPKVKEEIKVAKRCVLKGQRLHRRLEARKRHPNCTVQETAGKDSNSSDGAEQVKEEPDPITLGRKRSIIEILKCDKCQVVYNRDVNASINILNKFIRQVHNQQ